MPLDQTNWKQDTETKPDLSKPSLEGLSWLLRHLSTELPTHKYEHYNFATNQFMPGIQPAPPEGEPDWQSMVNELDQVFCQHHTDADVIAILKKRFGLMAMSLTP